MPGHKELLQGIARDVLACDASPSSGQNEMGWFSLGIIYASVHFTMSVVNKNDEQSDDYVAGFAAALCKDRKAVAMRMLDYANRHGELLDCMTLDQLKSQFTQFRQEMQKHLNKDEQESD